jgi:GTP-dependent phosphoenolpyruvate carboxykinase
MLEPTIPGWTVETIGDDIAWMRFGEDGRLYAINPEAGFFGVAPGTGAATNANAVATFTANSIFTAKLPRLFYVNWFRKNDSGRFMWPGFGENIRVLKWIIQRLTGQAQAVATPSGYLPAPGSLDLDGLKVSWADLARLLTVDTEAWKLEAEHIPEHFQTFHRHLPARLRELHQELVQRLG